MKFYIKRVEEAFCLPGKSKFSVIKCDRRWDKRKHSATVAVAVSTVAVVVRQLIRGNAIAHVVFDPWCDRKPRKEWPGRSVLTDVTRLAWVEQHRSRREGDGIGHQHDELPRGQPAHVAHRQLEAEPEEPEEQGIDLFHVVSEPQLRWRDACLSFHHFNIRSWLP